MYVFRGAYAPSMAFKSLRMGLLFVENVLCFIDKKAKGSKTEYILCVGWLLNDIFFRGIIFHLTYSYQLWNMVKTLLDKLKYF